MRPKAHSFLHPPSLNQGLLKGLGRGVAGAAAHPLAGAAGFAAKATQGLASDMRHNATPVGYARAEERRKHAMRSRQPRLMGSGASLLPYPRE